MTSFSAKIETGMVVDTTMPISIIREAFHKCPKGKRLRAIALLTIARGLGSGSASRPFFSVTRPANRGCRGFLTRSAEARA
jgi:hypothetical protein